MFDIAFASAEKLAGLIRRRKIGCLELLDHYLKRVERYNPALNAIIATDIPAARQRAREADRALAKRKVWGRLHGVPMTVKEAFDIKGMKTTWGVPEFRDNVATGNALAIDRFLAAGAVIFGKTNVPMWLADGQSFNAIYGATKNPWNLSRTPGGSSGGSSAALAAGLTGIEIGSDIASSIRNPAHHCGVFGHKPTYGICPPHGHSIGSRVAAPDDINVVGPLARSAGDLDLGLSVMAGPDDIHAGAYKLALPPPRRKNLRDFRIGVLFQHPRLTIDGEMQGLLQKLADFLAKQKAKVSDTARPDIDLERVPHVFSLMLRAATSARQTDSAFAAAQAAARALSPDDQSHGARMMRGNTIAHRDWLMLDEERQRMRWKWHEYFKEYDLLLCPAFPAPAHLHIHDVPTYQRQIAINGKTVPYVDFLFWAGYAGMAYLPASVAPAGFTKDRLPVGVQIIGPYGGDRTTIHFAKLLEKEYQGFVPPPGYE
jgi:amidase